jgi:hypothetical protein
MPFSQRAFVWALIVLTLVAIAVPATVALMRHGSTAHATAGPTDINLYGQAGACDTNLNTGTGNTCTLPIGSSVTVKVQLDSFNVAYWNGIQARLVNSSHLTLTTTSTATVKNCPTGITLVSGGNGDFTAACTAGLGTPYYGFNFKGNVFQLSYTCSTQGLGTITMLNGLPPDSHITDTNYSSLPEANPTDVLQVNCTPPDAQIRIDKVDALSGELLGGACFVVEAMSQPLFLDRVSDNNSKSDAACDQAGLLGLELTDSNPNAGEIDVTIPGVARLLSNVWRVLETQAPPKHDLNHISYGCDFGPDICSLVIPNQRVAGNINVTFNDTLTGQPLAGQCVDLFPIGIYCDNIPADLDTAPGAISATVPLGAYTCIYHPGFLPADRVVKAPTTVDCSVSAAAPEANVKYNLSPTIPFNLKTPSHANLFLTAQGAKLPPSTCEASTDTAVFSHAISSLPVTPDPKDPDEVQRIGAFEMSVIYDDDLVCVDIEPGEYATDTGMVCFTVGNAIGCVTVGKDPPPSDSLDLARIVVRPQPELYKLMTASQDNGVIVSILNTGCNFADLQGHGIKKVGCDDAQVDIRWLEGDVNGDCAVDVSDQQVLAFRWGATLGQGALYNERFDLEPWGQINSDGDIDIKDVQFVFGRHGSTCENPQPDQPPRNGNVTNP